MTEAGGGPAKAAPTGGADRQSPGQVLKMERELRGLSVSQAAEELNLDRWIVEAIEADRFLALGAPVYARGHLRKYAVLLGVSPELIVDRYDALSGTPEAPVVTTTTTAHLPRRSRKIYILPAVLLVLVLLAGIWWWLASRQSPAPADGVVPATDPQAVGVIAAPLPSSEPVTPAAVPAAPPEAGKPRG